VAAAADSVVCDGQVEDQAPAARRILEEAADLHVAAPLACACCDAVLCADDVSSCPEESTSNSDGPVMRFSCTAVYRASRRVVAVEVHAVLLAAAQDGRALVAAGEGGEYRHLQTQCRADERLPQRLFPSIIGGRGPEGPEP
jgi:hypothetical protein